jgi:hypothetical protein
MFHVANVAVYRVFPQHYYIQWHGKNDTTCAPVDVFITAGVYNHSGWYCSDRVPVRLVCLYCCLFVCLFQ